MLPDQPETSSLAPWILDELHWLFATYCQSVNHKTGAWPLVGANQANANNVLVVTLRDLLIDLCYDIGIHPNDEVVIQTPVNPFLVRDTGQDDSHGLDNRLGCMNKSDV